MIRRLPLLLALLRKTLKDAGVETSSVEALARLDEIKQVVVEQEGRLRRVVTWPSPEQEELLSLLQVPTEV